MKLVTLEEAKLYISYDSDVMDNEIERQINAIEGYLFNGTGIDWSKADDQRSKQVAKDYLLFRLRCDYYNEYNEMNIWRLQSMINQLKVAAHYVQEVDSQEDEDLESEEGDDDGFESP